MNCSEAEYLAPLYFSHELDAQSMTQLEAHLNVCANCAHELQMLGEFDQLLKDVVEDESVDISQPTR